MFEMFKNAKTKETRVWFGGEPDKGVIPYSKAISFNEGEIDFGNELDKRNLLPNYTMAGKAIYIHPSGEYITTNGAQESLIYQKAFGGVSLVAIESHNYAINTRKVGPVDYGNDSSIIAYSDSGFEIMSNQASWDKYSFQVNEGVIFGTGMMTMACKDDNINPTLTRTKRLSMNMMYKHFGELPSSRLVLNDLRDTNITRKHLDLYEAQENVLQKLQEQPDGFHLLSGEVGVGKTHIAAKYINDLLEKKPDANILIIEPIDGVVARFKKLISVDVHSSPRDGNVVMTDNTSILNSTNINGGWDLVVFDEFHKMDKDTTVSRYPLDTRRMPANVLAMTGTVSNTYPEQIWSTAKNYVSRYAYEFGVNEREACLFAPFNSQGVPQLTSIRLLPEFFLEHVLDDKSVTLLRQDIKELGLEEKMPVNKFSAGFDLSSEDKMFYNFMVKRADLLEMSMSDKLRVLDKAFNTNQKEFTVQQTQVFGRDDSSFRLVDPDTIEGSDAKLLYLGRHDQPFVDKKIDFINNLYTEKNEKILVYLGDNDYGNRVVNDLNSKGLRAEFVDTHVKGAVSKINNSDADIVVFDINPIMEGIDLHANHVVWYSTPESAGLDEQACGRITRLSSEQTEKNFYYLYHKTTIQQELTNNIIRTNDINNLALKRTDTKTAELDLAL